MLVFEIHWMGWFIKKTFDTFQKIDYPAHFYIVFMVAITALSQKFFDPYPRIPERLELFPGLFSRFIFINSDIWFGFSFGTGDERWILCKWKVSKTAEKTKCLQHQNSLKPATRFLFLWFLNIFCKMNSESCFKDENL